MVGIGVALVYVGYAGVLQCLFWITGKNVGPRQLFGATWPPNVPGATGANSQPATQPAGQQGVPGSSIAGLGLPAGQVTSGLIHSAQQDLGQ